MISVLWNQNVVCCLLKIAKCGNQYFYDLYLYYSSRYLVYQPNCCALYLYWIYYSCFFVLTITYSRCIFLHRYIVSKWYIEYICVLIVCWLLHTIIQHLHRSCLHPSDASLPSFTLLSAAAAARLWQGHVLFEKLVKSKRKMRKNRE